MTCNEFSERIESMIQTLYRVSYSQLEQACDRDDAVGECLLKAWQKRHQLKDERYMQTWVIRILINECFNIREKKKRELFLEDMGNGEVSDQVNHDTALLRSPVLTQQTAPPGADTELHDMLINLEESLRLPIILHYIEGYTVKEIARILEIKQGTVKSRMSRGREKLREIIELSVES
ncbi:MAG: RNA polymerase sigma factor [Oscillospiraceae bacterium]|jgi:RNA polymerase sigma-70 factor (ECF subfamily)|nr:RNA polymerase sigma factor [Oscillospiraceae bacterium]